MSDDSDMSNNQDQVDLENGHYSSGSDQYSPSSDTASDEDDDEQAEEVENAEFDTDLPATHQYLGRLDDCGGYTLYDDGQILNNILAIHTNTLAFPGFTLPLVMKFSLHTERMIQKMREGYIFILISTNGTFGRIFDIGIVMEIFEMSSKRGSLNLKAKGRQRCKLIRGSDYQPFDQGMHRVNVQVLGEPEIPSPILNTELRALKSKRPLIGEDYEELKKNYKYRRYHMAQYPFPSWVYDRNEVVYYSSKILKALEQFYDKATLPKDPLRLSYWFVQNFQLKHEERLKILKCNNVLERLKLEVEYLKMERTLCCAHCNIYIAKHSDVFAMSKDGVQSNYCNPGGHVYETVTVLEAKNFDLMGETSKQFSWFPGYAWTIMQCTVCKMHLGWKFQSKSLQPNIFFGLVNSGLVIKTTDPPERED